MKRFLLFALVLLAALAAATPSLLRWLNSYQVDGEARFRGLNAKVEVRRDENGVPYLRAENEDDLWRANGYVAAQDRLFQMHLNRLAAAGRLAELAGEVALPLDKRTRAFGFRRIALKQKAKLEGRSLRFLERYAEGVNAFLAAQRDRSLEFRLAKLEPEPWTVEDSLSILFLMSWRSSANLQHEIVTAELRNRLGDAGAAALAPLNVNPDFPAAAPVLQVADARPLPAAGYAALARALGEDGLLGAASGLGSNNWAVSGQRSPSGKPIVANDPHLDARMLPGVWHPIGLALPDWRAIGFVVAGLPGITLGRTDHVAMGVTNAYVDVQDLYVERLDPSDAGRYLEGASSIPFETFEETLKIRDGEAPGGYREERFAVRATRRGPVVSDHLEEQPTVAPGTVWTLRWSPAEDLSSEIGFDDILMAKSAAEVDEAVAKVGTIALNWVFADRDGHLGFRVSGKAPIRELAGSAPRPVLTEPGFDWQDDWRGFQPAELMPHRADPPEGWLGTANHLTLAPDFPGYFTDFAASGYRYRRMRQLLDGGEPVPVDRHWQLQLDLDNLLARRLAPLMAAALAQDPRTAEMAAILRDWDHQDRAEQAAPLVFQETLRQTVLAMVRDEVGEEVAQLYLNDLYYWQERVESLLVAGDSPFFDDRSTPAVESRDDVLVLAALKAQEALAPRVGGDVRQWQWGSVHTLTLFHPLRRQGFGAKVVGSGPHPVDGSAETLLRAWYDVERPFPITHFASLRFVADLGDPDRLLYVLPGGVVDRAFHRHHQDQVEDFLEGRSRSLWFSDAALAAHTRHTLVLVP